MSKPRVKQPAIQEVLPKHDLDNSVDMPRLKNDTVRYGSFRGPFTVTISEYGKEYYFDEFASLGSDFLQAFLRAFTNYVGTYSYSGVKTHNTCARRFLKFLLSCEERGGHFQRFLDACKNDYSTVTRDDFELVLNDYLTHLHQKHGFGTTGLRSAIHATNILIRALSRSGVLPTVLPLRAPKAPRSQKTQTLLEAVGNAHPEQDNALSDAYDLTKAEPALRDVLRGLLHTGFSIPSDAIALSDAIANGERKLLQAIRSRAEIAITSSTNDWNKAQKLIAAVDFDVSKHLYDELIITYIAGVDPQNGPSFTSDFKNNRGTLLSRLFRPHDLDSFGQFLRFLCYLYFEKPTVLFNGHNRDSLNLKIINDSLRNYAKRYYDEIIKTEFPNINSWRPTGITQLLSADTHFQAATAVLVMVDTGINPQPCLDLPLNPFADADNPGFKSIASWKNRAGGKLIVDELPVHINSGLSAYSALCTVKDQNRYLYKISDTNRLVTDRLFVTVDGILGEGGHIRLQPITTSLIRTWLTSSLANDAEFQRAKITTRQIRPSVLTAHRAKHGLNAATRKAQHESDSSTQLYTDRPLFHIAYDDRIKHFQELFQAMAFVAIDELPSDIVGSTRSLKNDYQEALDAGLGVLRSSVNSKSDDVLAGTVGSHKEETPITIVMTNDNLANIMAFNGYLHESQELGLSERPELWMEYWLPWLVLTDEVIRRVQRGKWASMYLSARKLLQTRGPTYFPPLW